MNGVQVSNVYSRRRVEESHSNPNRFLSLAWTWLTHILCLCFHSIVRSFYTSEPPSLPCVHSFPDSEYTINWLHLQLTISSETNELPVCSVHIAREICIWKPKSWVVQLRNLYNENPRINYITSMVKAMINWYRSLIIEWSSWSIQQRSWDKVV